MKFINPLIVTEAMLTSSSLTENDTDDAPAYNAGTTYALGNRVRASHRIYESVQNANTGNPVTDAAWWVDAGPTNRWKMFDTSTGTVSTSTATCAAPIIFTLAPTQSCSALALLDLSAETVKIVVTHDSTTIYDKTYTLLDRRFLSGWWDYFFMPLARSTVLVVNDLPPVGTITVTLNGTGAACGTCVIGNEIDIGHTKASPSISIIDYSKKETDEFGITDVVQRGYSKRIDARFWFESPRTDLIANALAGVRNIPVIWLADDSNTHESLIAYGFYRDWGIDIQYPTYSEASIQIEGMT